MHSLVITDSGEGLISGLIAGSATATFTKVAASDHDYSGVEPRSLAGLDDIRQTVAISDVSRTGTATVEILAAMDNSGLKSGYYTRALGVYAEDSDGNEVLFAVSIEPENPSYLPPFNGMTVSSITYRLKLKVDNSEQIKMEVNPDAYPTVEQVENVRKSVEAHTLGTVCEENGVHGLRYHNGGFQGMDESGEWVDIGSGGRDGADGRDGIDGQDGAQGESAYESAVRHGFSGSEEEWLASLRGEPPTIGANGNWVIEGEDTGLPSRGAQGEPGPAGNYEIIGTSDEVRQNTVSGKLVDALVFKEVFQSVSEGKAMVASAITGKGVQTNADETFARMAENISRIQDSGTGGAGYSMKPLLDFSMTAKEGQPQIMPLPALGVIKVLAVSPYEKLNLAVKEG